MTWPGAVTKAQLDAGTDDPKQARLEVLDLADKFNLLQAHVPAYSQDLISKPDAAASRTHLGLGDAATETKESLIAEAVMRSMMTT